MPKPEDDPKVQELERILQSYYQEGGSASASKISKYTSFAMKNVSLYKMIVWSIERYLAKCPVEYRIHGIYTVDALMKEAKKSPKSGQLSARIESKLTDIFGHLIKHPKGQISSEDVSKVVRLIDLWRKGGVFSEATLNGLGTMYPVLSQSGGEVHVVKAEVKTEPSKQKHIDPLAFDYGDGAEDFTPNKNSEVSPTEPKPQSQAIINISQQLLDSISNQTNNTPQQTLVDPRMSGQNYDPRKAVRPVIPVPALDPVYLAKLAQSILPQLPQQPFQHQVVPVVPPMNRSLEGYFLGQFPVHPDNPQRIKHFEHSLPMDCMRILSRTLFIGNIPKQCCTNEVLELVFKPYNLESINLMIEKQTSFVKFITREDTERCKRELFEIDGQSVKVSYGCGFGKKELFDRRSGITTQAVSDMTDDEFRRIGKELGQQFLMAYWQQIVSTGQINAATVSPVDRQKAEDMGGMWVGGLVIEEPDIVPTKVLKRPRQE